MKINGKQVLLCLIGGFIGVALPMTLTYYGVSREVIEFLFYCLVFLVYCYWFIYVYLKRINDKFGW